MTDNPTFIWAKTEPDWHDGETGEDFLGGTWDAGYHKDGDKYIRADRAAPKVKALKWECEDPERPTCQDAIGAHRLYRVLIRRDGRADLRLDASSSRQTEHASEAEAKAAAQADFERRILEALE